MKRVEHLKDSFGHMLIHGNPGAEGPDVGRRVENNRGEITIWQALIQRFAHLTHHRDVKDIERRARESDAGDAVVDIESEVLKFFWHPEERKLLTCVLAGCLERRFP